MRSVLYNLLRLKTIISIFVKCIYHASNSNRHVRKKILKVTGKIQNIFFAAGKLLLILS